MGEQDGVAIMCRNHRGFIEATVACAKLGASVLYLNTAFAGPQIADVLRREAPVALIYDEEFAGLVREGSRGDAALRKLARAAGAQSSGRAGGPGRPGRDGWRRPTRRRPVRRATAPGAGTRGWRS